MKRYILAIKVGEGTFLPLEKTQVTAEESEGGAYCKWEDVAVMMRTLEHYTKHCDVLTNFKINTNKQLKEVTDKMQELEIAISTYFGEDYE